MWFSCRNKVFGTSAENCEVARGRNLKLKDSLWNTICELEHMQQWTTSLL